MWLSILGMYKYDDSIFSLMEVPEGIDKDAVIQNILLECAELEIVYPEFDIMKRAIGIWSLTNQITWEKLYNTTVAEYNPIWNVDADITQTTEDTGTSTNEKTGGDNRSINRTGSDNETVNLNDQETKNLTTTRSVQGFNSSTWAAAEKTDETGTDTVAHTGTDNIARTENISDVLTTTETENGNQNNTREYTERRTGNIGVTATQDLIKKEREIAVFNMIDFITKAFKYRFCVLVY